MAVAHVRLVKVQMRRSDMSQANSPAVALEGFLAAFAPSQVKPVGAGFAEYAAEKLPSTLTQLYTRHGIGWYGQQEFQLVDPGQWMPVLATWLGAGVTSIPFAVTSFGHLYHVDESGAVQVLDPHFLTNTVVAGSVDEFFGQHLTSDASHLADLRGPHQGARQKLGELADGELYYFTPMLPLGGTVSPESLDKGDGVAHLLATHEQVRAQQPQTH